MKKNNLKYLVDTLLFLSMVGVAFIGFLMAFFLAEGPANQISSKYFLGLHRHQWGDIHLYLSIIFSILVVFHLLLAWKWIKSQAERLFKGGWKTVLILTLAASFILIGLMWALLPKQPSSYRKYGTRLRGEIPPRFNGVEQKSDTTLSQLPAYGSRTAADTTDRKAVPEDQPVETEVPRLTRGRLSQEASGLLITGQMTLLDLEKQTGVSTASILSRMNLPADTPRQEPLGRLRRYYGFTIIQLRDTVESLTKKD